MATTYKVLAQAAPDATTETAVYTVPAATSAIISTMIITNQSISSGAFRISVRLNGEALSQKNYIAYDTPISANDSINLTLGITLSAGDIITTYCSSANMSVSIFGSEIA